jgi:uncharacterized protein (TIGR02145 family)
MKKIVLIITAVLLTVSLNAQSYMLNFAGTGDATIVDSVKVVNITRGNSITVNGTDVLSLNVVTGVSQINEKSDNQIKVYPNPSLVNTTVEFFVPEADNTTISVIDLLGKVIVNEQSKLERGIYTYQIEGLHNGVYTIQVKSGLQLYSGKILSQQNGKAVATITCNNFIKTGNTENSLKNMVAASMEYVAGDRLMYTAYSGNYVTIGVDVVTGNKTVTFKFINCTDGSNNHYSVLPMGTRTWMAENLKTPAYNDGTPIHYIADTTRKSPAYTWYTYSDGSVESKYGALYNWLVVGTGKLCPSGWHVASDYDWSSLQSDLGTNAGGKLKATTDWVSPNYGATNEIGFNAFPGGFCDHSYIQITDQYKTFGTGGYWWTSTPIEGGDFAYYRALSSDNGNVYSYIYGDYRRSKYFSVRCVKD